ncbi:MAG: sugar ABC transporter ATP-binding protein, partial [Ramlibacter sp.]|nr:sugar ABC transporter ATP-binding protein [Cryobacterium sp.]
ARWLAAGPKVLLLDDPTRGVDVGAKAEIYRIIRDLSEDGVSVVFSSSDVAELVGLADRVVAVADGRCVSELEGAALTESGVLEAISSRPAGPLGGDGHADRISA